MEYEVSGWGVVAELCHIAVVFDRKEFLRTLSRDLPLKLFYAR